MPQVVAAEVSNARAAARSNVFLAATLVAAGRSFPVRVKNISEGGALIDGADLPAAGLSVMLRRGSLSTAAVVAWSERPHCGVRFSTSIRVAEWVRRIGHPGQEQVDALVRLVRRPKVPGEGSPVLAPSGDSISAISQDLSETCDRLANFSGFVEEQAEELLRLDVIAQRLRQLLEAVGDAESLTDPGL